MSKTDKILAAVAVIILVGVIGLLVWAVDSEIKETNRKMSECFERMDDPKWCFENLK